MINIGKSELDSAADESLICREIVKEIMRFGIDQQQIMRTLYLLSLELEDRKAMVDISTLIRNYLPFLNEKKNSNIITE